MTFFVVGGVLGVDGVVGSVGQSWSLAKLFETETRSRL